ncbi:hypothetical protein [Mycoplasmopsis edwardii]|nr:hypothetical protein [Mycoplasmopsis edwardii]
MKKSKFILPAAGILGAASMAAVVSCGTQKSSSYDSTEIVIAVDGVQKEFYAKVMELYNKTDSAKKYRIRTFEKDVFGALDITTQGINSSAVADIFYMPADRVTDFTQANRLSYIEDLLPNIFEEIATKVGATEEEKSAMRQFGTITGRTRDKGDGVTETKKELMAIRHNTEGIIMASRLPESDARAVLSDADTDTLIELVKTGRALFRFQDFWFGNGLLAGAFEKIKEENKADATLQKTNLMQKILYTDGKTSKVTSGFIEGNEYNEHFKKALKVMSSIFFPIYEAAYLKSESDFANTVWGQKGISQGDLKETLNNNVGNAQARIFSLMKAGKVDFTVIGSWDTQNAEKSATAQSFFNVVKTDEDNEYLQGPGAWAYGINARNNASSNERKQALRDVLNAIFEVASYNEYFKKDSKIPFTAKTQADLVNIVKQANSKETTEVEEFAKSLGYASYDELKSTSVSNISKLADLAKRQPWGNSWSTETNKTSPMAEENQITAESLGNDLQRPEILSEGEFNKLKGKLGNILPLRNTFSVLLGLSNIDQLNGKANSNDADSQVWLVGNQILKPEALEADELKEAKHGDVSLHIRKLEKFLFGADGDDGNSKEELITQLTTLFEMDAQNGNTAKFDEFKNAVIAKAKDFVSKYASSTSKPSDENIAQAVTLYLNTYANPARVRSVVAEVFANGTFNKKDGSASEVKISDVEAKISSYEKKLTFNKLLNVFSSRDEIKNNGLGVLKAQKYRPDNSNPQFGGIWTNMNDNTFGNAELYNEMANQQVDTLEKFTDKIMDILNKKLSEQSGKLNATNATTYVEFE